MNNITENVRAILNELPSGVQLVTVGKGRLPEELREAVGAGAAIIGENYVQEASEAIAVVGDRVQWHFIGHLQKNKVKAAVQLFDMIETVDSIELAGEITKRCELTGKMMPVLIEINSGRESLKSGVMPEKAIALIEKISLLPFIKVKGLMTMGPLVDKPEDNRKYFSLTQRIFEQLKRANLPNVEMKYLSMGMSVSYRIAIAEGANLVRIGRGIFAR